jgi:hypothetical protein
MPAGQPSEVHALLQERGAIVALATGYKFGSPLWFGAVERSLAEFPIITLSPDMLALLTMPPDSVRN